MPTLSQILRSAAADQRAIARIRARLSHTQSLSTRKHLLLRIRRLEDHLNKLYAQFLAKNVPGAFTVFGSRQPRPISGIIVHVDVSVDGVYFSNPAPTVKNKQRVWVRTRVDTGEKSGAGDRSDLPYLCQMRWTVPKGWTRQDNIGLAGRKEFFVSLPLTVTREFKAPTRGSTKANWGVYVDVFHPLDSSRNPSPSVVTANPSALLSLNVSSIPNGYKIYTVNSSKRISATTTINVASAGAVWAVEPTEYKRYFVGSSSYRIINRIVSGPYAGKYIDITQSGVYAVPDF